LSDGDEDLKAIVLGDLAYPTVNQIFERSDDTDLEFDVFLGPHHCSKSVMYWQCEDDDESKLKQPLLDAIEAAARDGAYVVASSGPIPASNSAGDNPPHAKAADRYRELVDDGHFLCTGEHPTEEAPEPIVFELSAEGVALGATDATPAARASRLGAAVKTARGAAAPATQPVGFGGCPVARRT
jgi:hypothetical protein